MPAFFDHTLYNRHDSNRMERQQLMAHAVLGALQKAQTLITSGKFEKAESLCRKILKQDPHQPDALHLSGFIALQRKHYVRAIQAYEKALALKANEPNYHYNLGLAHLRSLQFDAAVTHLQKTVELQPELACAYSDLCLALTRAGNIESAIDAGRKAVSLLPEDAAAHNNLALAYDAWRDFEASFEHYLKAAELLPDRPSVQFDLGNVYVGRGDLEAARQCFRKVIQLQPNQLEAYGNLVRITKYSSPEHKDAHQLKAFLDQAQLSDDDRTTALFSLGKIYQDCSRYDEAFDYFQSGNQLQDKKHRFDPAKAAQVVSLLVDGCSSELFTEKRTIGNATETPVFVVGTPRSGTTLTEQILSSHPDVFGAGELHWVQEASSGLQEYLKTLTPYPRCLGELTAGAINELALKYLSYTHSLASGERRIVDKMPGNFVHLGLIHCLFPNARIIHCRREPRDACISMFCNYFPSGVPYSYDLYKLGAFYSQYERAMEHWRKVLPADALMEIDYESLVQNQEMESRRLVDFIRLEWHEDCLAFYKQKRRVNTASDTQVTRPMYSSSIGRWKHYEKHLQPLEEGFGYSKDCE